MVPRGEEGVNERRATLPASGSRLSTGRKVVNAPRGAWAEDDGVCATQHEGEKDDTVWVVTKREGGQRQAGFVNSRQA